MPKTRNPTAGELSLWLARYEQLNSDLERPLRRQFFMFAVAFMCRTKELEELFERPLGQTPRRHRSWFWYNAMVSSGLGHLWDEFAEMKNSGLAMREGLIRVRRKATEEQWSTLSRRTGCGIFNDSLLLNPHSYTHEGTTFYWSRGGCWDTRSNITKVVVLGEHLPERDHTFNTITAALTPEQCRKLETEVYNLVDEESLLTPDAIDLAVRYVRNRFREMIGWSPGQSHAVMASWFFQTLVPVGKVWYNWKDSRPLLGRKRSNYIHQWFPPED